MEMTLNNMDAFQPMTSEEMMIVEGGGIKEAGQALAGTLLIAWAPAVGIGVSVVGTPVSGGFAAASMVGFGMTLIGNASH